MRFLICSLIFIGLLFVFAQWNVTAYSALGSGFCNCSNCTDCTNALNDSTSCYVEVDLTSNISNNVGNCIYNPANFNNKTFDCRGHTIDGDDSGTDNGIYLEGKTNNTIRNCTITDFSYGLQLYSSSSSTVVNNTVTSNSHTGIYLFYTRSTLVSKNTANLNTYYGILLRNSYSNNTLTDNTANLNGDTGIFVYSSSNNNNIIGNTVLNNTEDGLYLGTNSYNNIVNSNRFCSNNLAVGSYYDVENLDSNSGRNNTCDSYYNWNDEGTGGCAYMCSGGNRYTLQLSFGWNLISLPF